MKTKRSANCGNCGKEFEVRTGSSGQFCSRACVSPGRSNLDEEKIIALYSQGMGLKAIAREMIGRDSAKNTIRYALIRNGIEIRTVAETANDPATKLRKLNARGVTLKRDVILGIKKRPKQKRGFKNSGLELFEQAALRKEREWRERNPGGWFAKAKQKAIAAGFTSEYQMRYQTDSQFRAKELIKRRFQKLVKGIGHGSTRMMRLIGCTPIELREWIELQWGDWMTWDNIGKQERGKWQVDHIIPCSWFDQENEEHLKICWNYLNFRPLCAMENNARRDRPVDLIETLTRLPESPMKEKMIQFATLHHNNHD